MLDENEEKHDKAEDAQGEATPSSKTKEEAGGYEKKAEHAVVEEAGNSEDSPAVEAPVEDNRKHDKVEDAQGAAATSSNTERDEKEAEPAVAAVEKIDGSPSSEALVSDILKEEKELIPDAQTVSVTETAPEATKGMLEVQETTEEQEKESQEKAQEVEQSDTVAVSDLSAKTNEQQSDTTENSEPVVTEVREKLQEPEKSIEAEKPNTVEVSDSDPLAEASEKASDAIQNPEPLVTEEIETNSEGKPQDTGQPTTVATPESSAKTSEKLSDAVEEKTRETEFDAEVSKEANNYEARPTESEKAEPVVTETTKTPSELEKQSSEKEEEEQQKTVIHQTESESAEKPGDTVEVQPPQESDLEAVKETGDSNEIIKEPISLKEENDKVEETGITGSSAQVSLNEEAQAVTENLVESSPAAAEKVVQEACTNEVEEVSKEVDGVLKDPQHASTNQEAKTELKEGREYSAPISVEEKVAANEDKKQAGAPEESSRGAEVEIKQVEEQNEAKTAAAEAGAVKTENVTDERAVLDNEKRGQPEIKVDEGATVVTEQVRETLASKLEEKEEESVKTGVDNMKKVQIEEPVKNEVQTPEPPTKESDATKTSQDIPKETPAKPAQKQSNNILSKVKQSLVKAKKAIIGKSPTSKTVSS